MGRTDSCVVSPKQDGSAAENFLKSETVCKPVVKSDSGMPRCAAESAVGNRPAQSAPQSLGILPAKTSLVARIIVQQNGFVPVVLQDAS